MSNRIKEEDLRQWHMDCLDRCLADYSDKEGTLITKDVLNVAYTTLEERLMDMELIDCRCGKEAAIPMHSCPYNEEIHNDSETLCTCCDTCAYECSRDI